MFEIKFDLANWHVCPGIKQPPQNRRMYLTRQTGKPRLPDKLCSLFSSNILATKKMLTYLVKVKTVNPMLLNQIRGISQNY